jgi:hypothetical protein
MRIALLCCLVAACQPLYGERSEKLHDPKARQRPDAGVEAAPEIKYIEDCNADFRKPAVTKEDEKAERAATDLVTKGNSAVAKGDKEANPGPEYKDGIDSYRQALLKDPYNVEATLQLAIAYDKVWRKGCALQLLHRLAALSANPKWKDAATAAIDTVSNNSQLFKGYRSAAISAVGR